MTSDTPACAHDYILCCDESCLALANYCSSTYFNYMMMLPVKVDLPESTCPTKTILTLSLARNEVLRYLLVSQS